MLSKNNINFKQGLSSIDVEKLKSQGLVNSDSTPQSKGVLDIFKSNFFTLFNLINLIIAIMILFTGSFKNLMFMIVVILNSSISLFQELRAKKTTEKLKLLTSKTAMVIRDSKKIDINTNEIVLGDIIVCKSGTQISADCCVLEGCCEVNESFLTGESDNIEKNKNDILLSGSFISSGRVYAKTVKIGKETFSAKISNKLENIKNSNSEIMAEIKKIIKIVSIIILPLGIPLFFNQFKINSFNYSPAALNTCAALIGMIPEGLALLTSSVLALGVAKLANKKILSKDIYAIESLAKIDTICFDKTGTITEGKFEMIGFIDAQNFLQENEFEKISKESLLKKEDNQNQQEELINAIFTIASSSKDNNDTLNSIKAYFYKKEFSKTVDFCVSFSSSRKFSSLYFENEGSYILGSIEMMFGNSIGESKKSISELIKKYEDYRILAVAFSKDKIEKDSVLLNSKLKFLGLVILRDKIRKNIETVIDFLNKNKINIKIISGDSLESVKKIARVIGIKNGKRLNAINMKKDYSSIEEFDNYDLFARATPENKLKIIKKLKSEGKCVAMIGDGINDILALKEANCSITLASGSPATREVAQIILINEDFSLLPKAILQGIMSVNNIKTTSSLFLVKTIYSIILSILMLLFSIPYPFLPIHMSLISATTIGVPSFLLSFEKNIKKTSNSIFSNIKFKSLPAAASVCINLMLCFIIKNWFSLEREIYSCISVITTECLGIFFLRKILVPMNMFRKIIFSLMIIIFLFSIFFLNGIFSLISPFFFGARNLIITVFLLMSSLIIYEFIFIFFKKNNKINEKAK